MDINVFLELKDVYIEQVLIAFSFVSSMFVAVMVARYNTIAIPVILVAATAISVFIAPKYNNLEANGLESLKTRKVVIDKDYFTSSKFVELTSGTKQVIDYCLDLETKELSASIGEAPFKKCSAENKAIIFSNFNGQNFEKIKDKAVKAIKSENLIDASAMDKFVASAVAAILKVSSGKEADDIDKFFSEGFEAIKPYIFKKAFAELNSEIQALDLTTKTGIDRFKVLIQQTKTECFTFDENSCSKIKSALVEVKAKFDTYNPKEELKSVNINF